ncbi:hypothetical protein PICSAR190_04363 [Mycobacterium avium subsp. paratuberculosis]|nr:hypothetical protein PICSAR190_04363 [Mycobacterium avium subsp. paratuberculosis]
MGVAPGLTNASAKVALNSQVIAVRPFFRTAIAITSAVNPVTVIDGIRRKSSAAAQPFVKRSPMASAMAVIRMVPMSARTTSAITHPVTALARCMGSTHIRLSTRDSRSMVIPTELPSEPNRADITAHMGAMP